MGSDVEQEAKQGPDAPEGSLTQRIHAVYAALPDGERRAADTVLEAPGELATLGAGELAGRAGVSTPTVSRFVRRLGYGGYEEARRAARAMRVSGSPLYLARAGAEARKAGRLETLLETEAALLEASLAMQNPLTLDALAERLAQAPRVRLAGFRNSHFAAEYGRSVFAQVRGDVEMLNAPGQTLAEGIAGIGPGDVALVLGLRRRPAGFTRFVETLAGTGADVALIADRSVRGAPAHARWNLTCAVETPQLVDSYGGVMAVLRALAIAMLDRLGRGGRRHLERIEGLHEALGELE
ncbi:MAG: MurR/RpiR family transcriptional regulator [Pseudomonadota bacterium]